MVRPLVAWFREAARALPWRVDRTPYRVWVSEVMLQQTRVETVLRYYAPFLARFPDVAALARATEAEVLAAWSGLGYYRRARALHAGAREIVAKNGGTIPATREGLLGVRGIGEYTAGAILSFAHDVPAPAVDGNVGRVLSRLDLSTAPPLSTAGKRALAARAEELARVGGARLVAEALIELGAVVCTPRAPRCDACPVAQSCLARAAGRAEELPVSTPKRAVPLVHVAALVARRRGEVLVGRRRGDGLYGGLWEPPMATGATKEAAREALVPVGRGEPVARLRHLLTHRTFDVEVLEGSPARYPAYPETYDAFAWVREVDLGRGGAYGASTLAMKVLRATSTKRR